MFVPLLPSHVGSRLLSLPSTSPSISLIVTAYLRALGISDARIGVMGFSALTLSQANVLLFSLVDLFGSLRLLWSVRVLSLNAGSSFYSGARLPKRVWSLESRR